MDNPEPTEQEHELEGTERHREEEDMRGADTDLQDTEPKDAEDDGDA